MPGGILSMVFRKQTNIINNNKIYSDTKGYWNSIELEANKKQLLIIVGYRLPRRLGQGIYTVKSQLDTTDCQNKTASTHCQEFL